MFSCVSVAKKTEKMDNNKTSKVLNGLRKIAVTNKTFKIYN